MNVRMSDLRRRIWEARYLYLLLLPLVAFLIFFRYIPMLGLQIAFKKYSAKLGIWGSKWIGMANFQRIFISPDAIRAIKNTIIISLSRLVFEFPIPIALALLINEMPGKKLKRVYQTVLTFPHFLSWVIVASILMNFLSNTGALNSLIVKLGGTSFSFLSSTKLFRPLLYITANWKNMGYSSIIYIAALTAVSPSLHEAAMIDGANRFQRVLHVDIPTIMPTVVIMLILSAGRIMSMGFEKSYLMQNSLNLSKSEVIATFIYKKGLGSGSSNDYSYATAIGMFNSLVNTIMIVLVNTIARRIGETSLW